MPKSEHPGFYLPILCGESLRRDLVTQTFIELGLIHLILITTHHLHALDHILSFFDKIWSRLSSRRSPVHERSGLRSILRVAAFSILVLIGGAKVYLVRAWLIVVMHEADRFFRLGWRPVQRVVGASVICLMLYHDSRDQLALCIGWAASLAFAVHVAYWRFCNREKFETARCSQDVHRLKTRVTEFLKRQLSACSLLYLFLLPLFLAQGWPSAWIIFCNALLAPIFSPVLFPLAFAFRISAVSRPVVETIVHEISKLLLLLADQIPRELRVDATHPLLLSSQNHVSYLILLSLASLLLENLLLHPERMKSLAHAETENKIPQI